MAFSKIIITLCLLLALLSACGQRGPLFLPDKNTAPVPAQDADASEEPAPKSTEGKDEEGR